MYSYCVPNVFLILDMANGDEQEWWRLFLWNLSSKKKRWDSKQLHKLIHPFLQYSVAGTLGRGGKKAVTKERKDE